uniref:THAP4-like heme-binding domain-containing protein n=1 Tax=Ananas comosus var. bracteatus TaxID=296719 RepID=A0A6V7PUK7_ANACO|nr:unnamed protein product [Ananas comosus var. bracteatus]
MESAGAESASLPLHPALVPLSHLLGRWRGEGEGGFPTINSFRYGEELLFSHSGKPEDVEAAVGEPMHAESGYWRPKPDGSLEVVLAQSTGIVEVQKGSYDAANKIVTLQSELVGNASKVKEITRNFKVVDGELSYVVQMATTMTSLQPHLKALLRKI